MTPQSKRPRRQQPVGGAKFFFDAIHGPDSTQLEVFEHARELVAASRAGYNSCVLAYGATGSGKTHTLHGTPGAPSHHGSQLAASPLPTGRPTSHHAQ